MLQNISKIQARTYKPDLEKQHSYFGSSHNFGLDKIREKYSEN